MTIAVIVQVYLGSSQIRGSPLSLEISHGSPDIASSYALTDAGQRIPSCNDPRNCSVYAEVTFTAYHVSLQSICGELST